MRDDEVTGPSLLTSQFNLDLHNLGANFHRGHPSSVSRQVMRVRQPRLVSPLHQHIGAGKYAGDERQKIVEMLIFFSKPNAQRTTGAVKSMFELK